MKVIKHLTQQWVTACLLCSMVLVAVACKKEEDKAPAVQDKVTGIRVALTSEQKGVLDVNVNFHDTEGLAGKSSPNAITLDANTTYTGALLLEDASKSPARDVTAAYEVSFHAMSAGVAISQRGQELSVETGSAVSGTLHVDLKRNGQTLRVSFPLVVRE